MKPIAPNGPAPQLPPTVQGQFRFAVTNNAGFAIGKGILRTLHTNSVRRRSERYARPLLPFAAGTLYVFIFAASVIRRETGEPREGVALLEVFFGAGEGQGCDAQGEQEERLGKHCEGVEMDRRCIVKIFPWGLSA